MTQKMQDDDFEALLGRALRMEVAPPGLQQRVRNAQNQSRGSWFLALVSPARIAAGAAILSLVMGFALGWDNTAIIDDQDMDLAAVLYAANDTGDL